MAVVRKRAAAAKRAKRGAATGLQAVAITVNRRREQLRLPPFRRLIDVLREDLGLTGTKEGCGEGECGACTVLLDGEPVNSCLIPVCQVEGQSVRTVESLGTPEALSGVQQAFLEHGGAQCGICTPGMLMAATAWVEQGGSDDPDAIRRLLAGNLCRCTGYQHIVDSVIEAVRAGRRPAPRRTAAAASDRKIAARVTPPRRTGAGDAATGRASAAIAPAARAGVDNAASGKPAGGNAGARERMRAARGAR